MGFPRQAFRGRGVGAAALAVAASAILYALAFPPFGWSAISWIALVPLLGVWERQRPLPAAALGLAHGTLISLTTTPWLVLTIRDYFGRSLPLAVGLLVLFGLATLGIYHAVAFAVLSFLRRRLSRTLWLVLIPLAWIATEFARSSLGLRCPWEKLGDAHWQAPWLRQLASLGGVYGISGLVVLGNVAIAEALREVLGSRRHGARPLRRPAMAFGLAFLVALGLSTLYGRSRLQALRPVSNPVGEVLDVAVIQGNVQPSLRWNRIHAGRVLRRYGRMTREVLLDGERPDLIVWPEQALQTAIDDPTYGPPLERFIAGLGTPILFGAPRSVPTQAGGREVTNSVYLVEPRRDPLRYDKMRLVPFSETHPWGRLGERRGDLDPGEYSPGRTPGLFDWSGPKLGILICFEAVYPEMARALARGRARVLINVSNDGWFLGRGGQEQHLGQVVFRAVETGLPVVRSTTTGISAWIAPDGRVLQQLGRNRAGVLRLGVEPGARSPTLYTRIGDSLPLASLALLGAALALAWRRRPAAPGAFDMVDPDDDGERLAWRGA